VRRKHQDDSAQIVTCRTASLGPKCKRARPLLKKLDVNKAKRWRKRVLLASEFGNRASVSFITSHRNALSLAVVPARDNGDVLLPSVIHLMYSTVVAWLQLLLITEASGADGAFVGATGAAVGATGATGAGGGQLLALNNKVFVLLRSPSGKAAKLKVPNVARSRGRLGFGRVGTLALSQCLSSRCLRTQSVGIEHYAHSCL
jgi:hypothetical protein